MVQSPSFVHKFNSFQVNPSPQVDMYLGRPNVTAAALLAPALQPSPPLLSQPPLIKSVYIDGQQQSFPPSQLTDINTGFGIKSSNYNIQQQASQQQRNPNLQFSSKNVNATANWQSNNEYLYDSDITTTVVPEQLSGTLSYSENGLPVTDLSYPLQGEQDDLFSMFQSVNLHTANPV